MPGKRVIVITFAIGFIVGIVLLVGALYTYARLGYIDFRADQPVSQLEKSQAMAFVDSSTGRNAPETKNPVPADEANLTASLKLFQSHCSECHGDINHDSSLSESFYPRPPQFQQDKPDMEENENFYLIKNGIRWTGMPAWKRSLTDQQIWQLVTFLSHIDNLPAPVQEQWRALAK
ncbi:MAG: c-type cytochrome [Terriglobia bacterium]